MSFQDVNNYIWKDNSRMPFPPPYARDKAPLAYRSKAHITTGQEDKEHITTDMRRRAAPMFPTDERKVPVKSYPLFTVLCSPDPIHFHHGEVLLFILRCLIRLFAFFINNHIVDRHSLKASLPVIAIRSLPVIAHKQQ